MGVPLTTAVNNCASTLTVMRVPVAALVVPEIVAVGLLVRSVGAPSREMSGGTVSIVSCWVALPTFPAPSVVDASTVYVPSGNIVGVTDQLPSNADGLAVSVWPATVTVTTPAAPTLVVPPIVGLELLISSAAPPVSVTVGGAL